MKNVRFTLLLLWAATALLSSCKKEKDPAPDLATRVASTYVFSELFYDGRTIPAKDTDLKGSVRITRKTETTVDIQLDIRQKSTNDDFMAYDVEGVILTENGSEVFLAYEGEQFAKIKGDAITVTGEDSAGERFAIIAKR
ncbi:hypothetical protein GCM10027275_23320 [Rhabdobacter roseus]|uniref:Outer membrane lipopolysaccharide assembly protein LptE/RlpB n=1 Tax=Rhabdobacter roseus TaxID=1655419 RepID=A0A840TRT8_9BACT|nr:hypothetical protein [Rhabdobacter roseus]MBB5284272.1 outer membrane lipopolysaccharide assembly protein LptE/RlpB [Rhabdobacter roseus]